MTESAFQNGTRLMIERDIEASLKSGDSYQVNEKLRIWPYGKERKDISIYEAHEIARESLARKRNPYGHDTEEMAIIAKEMLD